jgi:glycosyltransferase involved in cell wall biosynthesis
MKILLTNFHPYSGGGQTTFILSLFKALRAEHEVFIVCPGTSKLNLLARNISQEHVFDLDFPHKAGEIRGILITLRKMIHLLGDHHFDVIHVNGLPDQKIVIFAKIFSGVHTPIIKTKHDSKPPKFHHKFLDNFFTRRILLVSRYLHDLLLSYGYDDQKLTVTPLGIDTQFFAPRRVGQDLRTNYHVGEDHLVFVSVAGTALHKGWQFLVEAVSLLEENDRKKIAIIVAGEPPSPKTVERFVEKFNMTDQVIFPGYIADVRDIIATGDVGFVLSHRIESISYACREMMAMGKPVLLSDYAGLPENIDPGINGWLVKSGDIEQIHNTVKMILANRKTLINFSQAARSKAEAEFNLESFIHNTLSCYAAVARSGRHA